MKGSQNYDLLFLLISLPLRLTYETSVNEKQLHILRPLKLNNSNYLVKFTFGDILLFKKNICEVYIYLIL